MQNGLLGVSKVLNRGRTCTKESSLRGQVQGTTAALLAPPSSPTREPSSFPGETRISSNSIAHSVPQRLRTRDLMMMVGAGLSTCVHHKSD